MYYYIYYIGLHTKEDDLDLYKYDGPKFRLSLVPLMWYFNNVFNDFTQNERKKERKKGNKERKKEKKKEESRESLT